MATIDKSSQPLESTRALPFGCKHLKDLETSEELEQAVRLICEKLGVRSGAERRRIEEDLKLQYHFGGQDVACLPSEQGRILIAAGQIGNEAFTKVLESLDPQQRRRLIFCSPLPWAEPASSLLI
jgi:hypothetical protein